MVVLSDYPIDLNKKRWQKILCNYTIDGQPSLYLAQARDKKIYKNLIDLIDNAKTAKASDTLGLEYKANILKRIPPQKLITDDNMGTEWP